jgi:hypothetical protein
MPDYYTEPDENGLPRCTNDECRHYDGKRCRVIGFRPGLFCEPALIDLKRQADITTRADNLATVHQAASRVAAALEGVDRVLWPAVMVVVGKVTK